MKHMLLSALAPRFIECPDCLGEGGYMASIAQRISHPDSNAVSSRSTWCECEKCRGNGEIEIDSGEEE